MHENIDIRNSLEIQVAKVMHRLRIYGKEQYAFPFICKLSWILKILRVRWLDDQIKMFVFHPFKHCAL